MSGLLLVRSEKRQRFYETVEEVGNNVNTCPFEGGWSNGLNAMKKRFDHLGYNKDLKEPVERGFTVLRISDEEIMIDPEKVTRIIGPWIESHPLFYSASRQIRRAGLLPPSRLQPGTGSSKEN
jgi:hypothetical protein